MPSRGERTAIASPPSRMVPEVAGSMPNSARPTSVRPAPIKSGEAQHFAAAQIESYALEHAAPAETRHRKQEVADGADVARRRLRSIWRPTMSAIARPRRRLRPRAGRNQSSVAKDRNLVGELEHLLHAMADEQDRDALTLEIAHQAEQLLGLVRGKRRRRFVHDEDANVHRNRLGDLHRLLRRQRQAARGTAHVERDAEFCENRLGLAEHLRPADHGASILVADENVLRDIEIGKQQRFLIDRRNAHPLGLGRAGDRDAVSVQPDLAAVGLMNAGDDLNQRRLAGAVLAEQSMDFTGIKRKRYVLQRLRRVEPFGDAADIENRRVALICPGHGSFSARRKRR